MKKINQELLDELLVKAENSSRKRANYNFHKSAEETMHRMLNCMNPGTYVAPHKHQNPDKNEAFIILKGKILIITFNEEGDITTSMILEAGTSQFGAEIPPRTYHTLIPLEQGSILYEVKDGPWDIVTDKTFAPWAPKEGEEGTLEYNNSLLKKLGL